MFLNSWKIMSVIVKPIVPVYLGTVPKGLEKELDQLKIRENNQHHLEHRAQLKSTVLMRIFNNNNNTGPHNNQQKKEKL